MLSVLSSAFWELSAFGGASEGVLLTVQSRAGASFQLNNNNDFFLNNQPDALIIQIYSVIKLYMFRASSLPVIRSFILYNRQW